MEDVWVCPQFKVLVIIKLGTPLLDLLVCSSEAIWELMAGTPNLPCCRTPTTEKQTSCSCIEACRGRAVVAGDDLGVALSVTAVTAGDHFGVAEAGIPLVVARAVSSAAKMRLARVDWERARCTRETLVFKFGVHSRDINFSEASNHSESQHVLRRECVVPLLERHILR